MALDAAREAAGKLVPAIDRGGPVARPFRQPGMVDEHCRFMAQATEHSGQRGAAVGEAPLIVQCIGQTDMGPGRAAIQRDQRSPYLFGAGPIPPGFRQPPQIMQHRVRPGKPCRGIIQQLPGVLDPAKLPQRPRFAQIPVGHRGKPRPHRGPAVCGEHPVRGAFGGARIVHEQRGFGGRTGDLRGQDRFGVLDAALVP